MGPLIQVRSAYAVVDDLVVSSNQQRIYDAFCSIMDPLITSIRRDLSATVARLHRLDFGLNAGDGAWMSTASSYMKELTEKLAFIRNEMLSRVNAGDHNREWYVI